MNAPNALIADRESNALRASNPLAPASAHVNAALSDFASSYSNGRLFADRVSPVILVDKKSDSFHKFIQKDSTTAVDNRVGERGAIPEVTIENETGSYTCLGYGLRGPVSRALQATADPAVNPKQRTAKNLMLRNMLQREIRVAAQIMTAANWASANTAAATAVWSNAVTGVPLTDIQTAREAIPAGGDDESQLVGICALEVFHDLISHPQIRDLHGMSVGQIDAPTLASYLGLDELLVSDAQKNTANSGQAVSLSRIWTATMFAMVRVPKSLQGLDQQLFGCTFRRKIAGSSNGILVREWHVENEGTEGTDHLAVTHEDDEEIIQNNQGFLLTSCR